MFFLSGFGLGASSVTGAFRARTSCSRLLAGLGAIQTLLSGCPFSSRHLSMERRRLGSRRVPCLVFSDFTNVIEVGSVLSKSVFFLRFCFTEERCTVSSSPNGLVCLEQGLGFDAGVFSFLFFAPPYAFSANPLGLRAFFWRAGRAGAVTAEALFLLCLLLLGWDGIAPPPPPPSSFVIPPFCGLPPRFVQLRPQGTSGARDKSFLCDPTHLSLFCRRRNFRRAHLFFLPPRPFSPRFSRAEEYSKIA